MVPHFRNQLNGIDRFLIYVAIKNNDIDLLDKIMPDWHSRLSWVTPLPIEFIRANSGLLDWNYISLCQKLEIVEVWEFKNRLIHPYATDDGGLQGAIRHYKRMKLVLKFISVLLIYSVILSSKFWWELIF